MYLRLLIGIGCLFSSCLAWAQSNIYQKPTANLTTSEVVFSKNIKPNDSNKNQYLDYQTILGYTFSGNKNSPMNMHPEIGFGIGFKKEYFTLGMTGTIRFIKTRQSYTYYHLNDTISTRYFSNPAFSFYIHKTLIEDNGKELFIEVAPGFEVLYLEPNLSFNRTRANAISFHANAGIGYRITKKDLHYYQLSTFVNYNNFSFGKVTNIAPQTYFSFRLAFGFIAKDEWATKKNNQK